MRRLVSILLTGAAVFSLCACSFHANTIKDAAKYIPGNAEITDQVENLDIEWTSGVLNMIPGSDNTILLEESYEGKLPEEKQMHWYLDGTTLRVVYDMSLGINLNIDKTLTVTVPKDIIFDNIKLSVASAELNAGYIAARTADIDTASGNVNISFTEEMEDARIDTASGNIIANLSKPAEKLDIDSSSGNIQISAESKIKTVDVDSAAGNVQANFKEIPDNMKVDTASGNVTLSLPEESDITLDLDTASGKFESEIAFSIKNGDKYMIGSGTAIVDIDTASGDIIIAKND